VSRRTNEEIAKDLNHQATALTVSLGRAVDRIKPDSPFYKLAMLLEEASAALQTTPALSTPPEHAEIADELEKLAFMVGPKTHDLAEIIRGRPEYPRGVPLYQSVRALLNRASRALQGRGA
jgi:hypothetical protein